MRLHKRKKSSLSLSINAIVVLILAITMLGLGLGFIRTMFGKVSQQIEGIAENEPEAPAATSANPITLSRDTIVISPGETEAIIIGIFNTASGTFNSGAIIANSGCFSGGTPPLTLSSQLNKAVPSGANEKTTIVVKDSSTRDDK